MAFMFENLDVYQKAIDFADQVAALTEKFPRGYYFLVDQLNRAALSIATNLAEGNGRFTKPDRRHFFTMARGSAQECVPLLEIAKRRGLLEEPVALALKEKLEIIAKMISGLIKGLDKPSELKFELRPPPQQYQCLAGHKFPGVDDDYIRRNPMFVKDACAAIEKHYFG